MRKTKTKGTGFKEEHASNIYKRITKPERTKEVRLTRVESVANGNRRDEKRCRRNDKIKDAK